MSKKAMFVWCLVLGLLDGVYCFICSYIPHVQNYMWIGFISLPIYFLGGAKLAEMPKYMLCSASGVFWGAMTLLAMGLGIFSNGDLNMFVCVTVVVCICCFVHMGLLTDKVLKGVFSSCPMVFGGFAAIFSQGVAEAPWVILTLCLGVLLGWVMGWFGGPIAKLIDGNK